MSCGKDSSPNKEYKPLHNICEFLNALHIYTDEARHNITRYVEATHYCAHVRSDLRQCLIYDSPEKNARLIGVEYMIPKHVYNSLPDEEKKLWHSHDFEVKSGMLVLPRPEGVDPDEWERAETEAMKEIIGLYGKTWHFWQIDRGDPLPLGYPTLMGSLTAEGQVDLNTALKERDARFGVDHVKKAEQRRGIEKPDIHPLADSWWKEGRK
ncbi:hypothetical protein VTN96DRAFT_5416 [Rasamsonia emersonii]|uniref:DUF1264 domain protein n=1 Tax=Rasamsonia emersonii (strain ATCC 16479 / CBS 393.64 / IMI 116815) TaxID=1408163 RepID=A0A0F4Z3C1_RASE3|nr:hypothetical protein T310_1374 [Rasamsonia emersonii CBS 393.64]KKA24586.1 hypothetical protein T310_1374 [Rasamsonia emersonii CBS 393.64]